SLTEGSGNVLLEAAASSRPTVGTRVGGIPDYIVEEETGLLVNKRDPEDLADKLRMILDDETLARAMGAAGRSKVETDFRYEQMIDGILRVYDEVLR
ncbi:MAG: glycosyltransferase family 4 protein, partial [Planctomycetaceae bacterium]